MKPEQENFDDLRRLLKLKRYEKPPPGFFNDFSANVIAQIKVRPQNDRENFMEWLFFEAPWLQRIFQSLESKPAVAWGFGMAVCAMVIGGVVFSESAANPPIAATPAVHGAPSTFAASHEAPFVAPTESPLLVADTAVQAVNTNGPASGSIFDLIQPAQSQPVAAWPGQ